MFDHLTGSTIDAICMYVFVDGHIGELFRPKVVNVLNLVMYRVVCTPHDSVNIYGRQCVVTCE